MGDPNESFDAKDKRETLDENKKTEILNVNVIYFRLNITTSLCNISNFSNGVENF